MKREKQCLLETLLTSFSERSSYGLHRNFFYYTWCFFYRINFTSKVCSSKWHDWRTFRDYPYQRVKKNEETKKQKNKKTKKQKNKKTKKVRATKNTAAHPHGLQLQHGRRRRRRRACSSVTEMKWRMVPMKWKIDYFHGNASYTSFLTWRSP